MAQHKIYHQGRIINVPPVTQRAHEGLVATSRRRLPSTIIHACFRISSLCAAAAAAPLRIIILHSLMIQHTATSDSTAASYTYNTQQQLWCSGSFFVVINGECRGTVGKKRSAGGPAKHSWILDTLKNNQ